MDALGKELLAGSGFSPDQHGGVGARIFARHRDCFLQGSALAQDVLKAVFGGQALFMQFQADFFLAVHQGIHILEGSHGAHRAAVDQNGHPVDVHHRPVDVQQLIQLDPAALQRVPQICVGQDQFHGLSQGAFFRGAQQALGLLVQNIDFSVFVDGKHRIVGIVQHGFMPFQLDAQLHFFAPLQVRQAQHLIGPFDALQNGLLGAFHHQMPQPQLLGAAVGICAADAQNCALPDGLRNPFPAFAVV